MGRIGSAVLVSTQTKTASAATDASEQPDDHRRGPGVLAAAPAGGERQARCAESDEEDARVVDDRLGGLGNEGANDGMAAAPTISTTTATGMLIQNAHRHVRWSVKKPPSSGPITVVTPNTAPSAPW